MRIDAGQNRSHDPVRRRQDVGCLQAELAAPLLDPRRRIDQLHGHAQIVLQPLQAALNHEIGSEALADLHGVGCGFRDLGRRKAIDDGEQLEPAKSRGDVLGQPFAKHVEVGLPAHVVEGHDRDRRPLAASGGSSYLAGAGDGCLLTVEDIAIDLLRLMRHPDAKLLGECGLALAIEPQGLGALVVPRQQPHERPVDGLAQPVTPEEVPGKDHCRSPILRTDLGCGQALDHRCGQILEPLALGQQPLVIFGTGRFEAVEQRT